VELKAAIHRFFAEHNRDAEPLVWTADPDRILAKLARGR
jgi:hypothetical protein